MGAGYGWNAQQVRQNRAFNFDNILDDKDKYDTMSCEEGKKKRKKKKDSKADDADKSLEKFSFTFW